jgi:hypothetical protein
MARTSQSGSGPCNVQQAATVVARCRLCTCRANSGSLVRPMLLSCVFICTVQLISFMLCQHNGGYKALESTVPTCATLFRLPYGRYVLSPPITLECMLRLISAQRKHTALGLRSGSSRTRQCCNWSCNAAVIPMPPLTKSRVTPHGHQRESSRPSDIALSPTQPSN